MNNIKIGMTLAVYLFPLISLAENSSLVDNKARMDSDQVVTSNVNRDVLRELDKLKELLIELKSDIKHSRMNDLFAEVQYLRHEVSELKSEIEVLKISSRHSRERHGRGSAAWGCYMKDLRVGGLSGAGDTMAEAKGVVLEKCTEKGGACFESDVKCSNNKE